jgi:hypothetical protein
VLISNDFTMQKEKETGDNMKLGLKYYVKTGSG